MNEKIKQLWRQVELQECDCGCNPDEFLRLKFAELIVRECMTICKEHPSRILSNNWNADAVAPDIVHRFEDHFGVEE